jgi:alkylation response protein AidB-like acyl-CoA dehydrogenase
MAYFEEIARRQIPRGFNPQGLGIVVPSLIDHGTEEQRRRYAIPTLQGDLTWALGMSEPDAGSDLAGLKTRAERIDDHFVVNGQKVWTSGAQHADYCLCFVRTDPSAPKHRGISVLIIDMSAPGIEWRPIPELTNPNRADFNELFLSDVAVPAENLVGQLNGGWSVASASLAHERGMLWISQVTQVERSVELLMEELRHAGPHGGPLSQDPFLRDQVAELYIDSQAMKALGYRGFAKFAKGMVSPEHSLLKLFGSELERRITLAAIESLGPRGLDLDAPVGESRHGKGYRDFAPWAVRYLWSFSGTIAGGTSEIQRNIIAERVLGLPRG